VFWLVERLRRRVFEDSTEHKFVVYANQRRRLERERCLGGGGEGKMVYKTLPYEECEKVEEEV
jgi:hypothetical protein